MKFLQHENNLKVDNLKLQLSKIQDELKVKQNELQSFQSNSKTGMTNIQSEFTLKEVEIEKLRYELTETQKNLSSRCESSLRAQCLVGSLQVIFLWFTYEISIF